MESASKRLKLGIFVSHPIQYFTPIYRELAASTVLTQSVYFLSDAGVKPTFDQSYGRNITLGANLLDGYDFEFLPNRSPLPSVSKPWGLFTPAVVDRVQKCDVIFVHGYSHASTLLAIQAARLFKVPYLLRCDSRPDSDNGKSKARLTAKKLLLDSLIKSAGACLSVGELNRLFYEKFGANPSRIVFAPYSIDNSWFQQRSDYERKDRENNLISLGLDPNLPTILFVGKFQIWKRPTDVLKAMSRVRKPMNWIFAGDGPLREEMESMARGQSRVVFPGYVTQDELPKFYATADILVLPSSFEPWGLVVNEAMACGLIPVVSDAVGCAADLVTGGPGATFRVGNVDELASRLDEVARRLGPGASERVRKRVGEYSISETARGVEKAALFATSRVVSNV